MTVSAPELTRVQEKIHANPVVLEFDGSSAPLKDDGKKITAGIEMSPKIDGVWKWESDRRLTFTPKNDWPIGQEYTVRLAKNGLVAPHINLSGYALTFVTAAFGVRTSESEFHQDPADANLKKVVATFVFTHPVDQAQFEKRLRLRLVPTDKQVKEADYRFRVSYDRFKMSAYVHSEPVAIPEKDAAMRITLEPGTVAARGGPAASEKIEQDVKVPGLYNFLGASFARLTVVDNQKNEPEQVLVLETSAGVTEHEMRKNVQVWLLPQRAHRWDDAEQVPAEILNKGSALKLEPLASEKEYATLHSFRLKAEVGRFIYVQVKKGLRAFGGYVLGDTFQATQRVGEFPRQLRILHSGALLAMSGERKVSVFARDVPAMRIEIGRILPEQLHHLFTQAHGPFAHPSYFNDNFDEQNLAEFFTDVRDVGQPGAGKPQYEAVDLGKHLSGRGVFLLRVQSWNPADKRALGEQDSRLILVSDLGIIVKDAAEGDHDVFVQSIHSGEPVGGARVQVIGKNGQPVATTTTDGEGRARVASFADFTRECSPVAYVVSKGRDTSFLPVSRRDRVLDMSRFDGGGVHDAERAQALTAYVFSDRGIYRPGDEIRAGWVVRSSDWKRPLAGLPLTVIITDARGLTVRKESVKLGEAGFAEVRHPTAEVAPTGTYTIAVHTVKDDRPASMLGSTTVRVREFLPDKMKVSVRLSQENRGGWVSPTGLKARVTLANLFGTPAQGRTVRGRLHLTPALAHFPRLRDFHFFDPMKAKDSFSDTLSDIETDSQGMADLDLALERFAPATYRLSVVAEGFESEGGRGVLAEVTQVISPLPYLVGYKPDGDLSYLSKGSAHAVEVIAVSPRGDKVDAKGLRVVLNQRKFVSVLTRHDNGTYQYESVKREVELSQKPFAIAGAGARLALATDQPGDFTLVVENDRDEELQRIEYTVAGIGNLTRAMDKNAELQLRLKKSDVEPGEELAPGDDLAEERVRAYAIYLLTRNGMITSGFAAALEKHLEANHPKKWKQDATGAYLASSYRLLKQDRLARGIIEECKLGQWAGPPDHAHYYDGLAHDAQLLYLLARHFPERAAQVTPEMLDAMVQPIFRGTYNT